VNNKDKQKHLFILLKTIKNIGYKTETYSILDINDLDSFDDNRVEFDIISKNEENEFTINIDYDDFVWHLTADNGHFVIGAPVSLNLNKKSLEDKLTLIINALL
jgi:hypothetical protein